jgi:8-oxo-dGTP pyrophosphatase MutT (NUDIX family)
MKQSAGILPVAKSSGKILLGKRTGSCRGTWASFGGGSREEETPRETAIREFREETGFSGKIGISFLLKSGNYHLFVGFVPIEFVPKLDHEHSEAKWYTYSEAKKIRNKHPELEKLFDLPEIAHICRPMKGE